MLENKDNQYMVIKDKNVITELNDNSLIVETLSATIGLTAICIIILSGMVYKSLPTGKKDLLKFKKVRAWIKRW